MARWNFKYKLSYWWMWLRQYCMKNWISYNKTHMRLKQGRDIERALFKQYKHGVEDYPWEEWRDIKWYKWIYEISNFWRIKSYYSIKEHKIIDEARLLNWRKKIQTTVYTCVTLYSPNDRKYHYKMARLVAQAFLGLDYDDKYTLVCHKDDDWENNKLDNLFLGTHKDNTMDSISKWRFKLNSSKNSWN